MNRKDARRQMERLYGDVARAYLKSRKVYRYNLKKISGMDDREVIQACHFWYEQNHLTEEYRAFETLYFQQHREAYLEVYPMNRKDDQNE